MKHRYTPAEILHIQRYVTTAKRCCLVISLEVLIDQFKATDAQCDNVVNLYNAEVRQFVTPWADSDAIRAEKLFMETAKRFKGVQLNEDLSRMRGPMEVNRMIWNAEAVGLYTMLRIIRVNLGANHTQLEQFCELYHEFNQLYKTGEQVDIKILEQELFDNFGYNIFKEERKVKDVPKIFGGMRKNDS